jgi:hypothetical protein
VSLTRQLFLDCDGVLADFNSHAESIFGIHPRKAEDELGTERFWSDLRAQKHFFLALPLMPDAARLFEAVRHLNPVILTGCPKGGWAEPQKIAWAAKHFPGTRMITCRTRDKRNYMKPGDVLVDDWPKYHHLWEETGGIFILHENAETTIPQVLSFF